MAINALDVLEQTKKESREIRATMHVPTAEAQFQKQVLATGRQQVGAVTDAAEVAIQAAEAQDRLGKAQASIQVDLAVAQAEVDNEYVAQMAPILAGREAQAAVIARRGAQLGEIAGKKHSGILAPITFLADQFKAAVIEQDLEDAATAYQSYDAQMQIAQQRRNLELTQVQNELVVIPTALAKERHTAAMQGLQAKGIVADATFKAAQINEDTAEQVRQSAQVGWQYEEAKRQAAAQKAAELGEENDGVYLLAATRWAQLNGGRWPTPAQAKADARTWSHAKQQFKDMSQDQRGALMIAGTRSLAKKHADNNVPLGNVLADLTNDAPATTSALLYELAGESQNSRAVGAALTPLLTAAVKKVEAENEKMILSPAEKKARVEAAKNAVIARAGQMPQQQLFDEAKDAMAVLKPDPTGADINTSVLTAVGNPVVMKQSGLSPEVLRILNSAPGRKILDDAPRQQGQGFTEKMFKLNQLLEANGVKDSVSQLQKFSREALRAQYTTKDATAKDMALAGRGEYIPVKLEISGTSAVRERMPFNFMSGVAADMGYDFGDYADRTIDLEDPAAFRRHLLMYQRSLQFEQRRQAPTPGQIPSGIFLGRTDAPQ